MISLGVFLLVAAATVSVCKGAQLQQSCLLLYARDAQLSETVSEELQADSKIHCAANCAQFPNCTGYSALQTGTGT